MPESERVRHVLKGIADEAVNLFVLQPPADVRAIVTIYQSLEAARRQRIQGSLVPSADTDISISRNEIDFQETIRRIVREEVARFFATTSMCPILASQHIRDIVKAKRTQPTPVPYAPVNTPPQPTYAEVLRRIPAPPPPQPLQPQLATLMTNPPLWQRPRTMWSTEDNRLTCYCCGIRGHISRFCRRRRAD
ncbi:unnamed protein product, partial [Ixodes hexagonus]